MPFNRCCVPMFELGTEPEVHIFECLHLNELNAYSISVDSSLSAPGSILPLNFRFAVLIYKKAQCFV